jgi:hypothetical protein
VKTLFHIKDWDFAWQDRYYFEKFPELPVGTRLDAEIHWDNSSDNPHNPSSPPVRVRWGEATKDEMGSISLIAVPHQESDLKALRKDISDREGRVVQAKMKEDPGFAVRLMLMLSE